MARKKNTTARFLIFGVVIIAVFLVIIVGLRLIDYGILFTFKEQIPHYLRYRRATDFNSYKDVVTVITGVLTLIIGLATLGVGLSFSKIKEKEQHIDRLIEKTKEKQNDLERFLYIEEARTLLYLKDNSPNSQRAAITLYQKAETCCGANLQLYLLKADAYLLIEQYADAITCYNKAKLLDGTSAQALLGLARAQYYELASSSPDKVIDKKPSQLPLSPKDWVLLNDTVEIENVQPIRGIIRLLQEAQLHGGDKAEINFELARIYRKTNKLSRAVLHYKQAYLEKRTYPDYGFLYCYYWIVQHCGKLSNISPNNSELKSIVKTLYEIGENDIFHSKEAYALLWYLGNNIKGLSGVNDLWACFNSTNIFTLKKLFRAK